jgi:hypothetical protein
MNMNDIDES